MTIFFNHRLLSSSRLLLKMTVMGRRRGCRNSRHQQHRSPPPPPSSRLSPPLQPTLSSSAYTTLLDSQISGDMNIRQDNNTMYRNTRSFGNVHGEVCSSTSEAELGRAGFPFALPFQLRWADNDQYGHCNNIHYYSLFDSCINCFLIQEGGLSPTLPSSSSSSSFSTSSSPPSTVADGGTASGSDWSATTIAFCAESGCQYLAPMAYPEIVTVGMKIEKIGNSSVRYGLAIMKPSTGERGGEEGRKREFIMTAKGHFVHVFVDRNNQRPTPIPRSLRAVMEQLQRDGSSP